MLKFLRVAAERLIIGVNLIAGRVIQNVCGAGLMKYSRSYRAHK